MSKPARSSPTGLSISLLNCLGISFRCRGYRLVTGETGNLYLTLRLLNGNRKVTP